jgi:hypothetical protein
MNADRANFYAQYRSLITTNANDVARRTAEGYVLIEVVPASQFQTMPMRRPQPSQNGYAQQDLYEDGGGVVQTPLFLMGKLAETELDEVRQRAKALEAEKNDSAQRIREFERAAKEQASALALMTERATLAMNDAATKLSSLQQVNTSLRKLEGDLARVRKHVGEKTFDEALTKS